MTTRVAANGIEIAYESFGSPEGRPLLLIMGLGAQLVHWDEGLCRLLAEQGHHVVRFDNRDVGLSTHFHDQGVPSWGTPPAYVLDDLADDTAGLMDALGWAAAHVVGASMGGMIAQTLAIRHPARVLTLTSIMSTPGPAIAPPTEAAAAVLRATPPADRESVLAQAVRTSSIIGSPGYELDRQQITMKAALAYDRCFDPAGTARQLAAIMASGDRTELLAGVSVPALVLHGEDDPLIPIAGGQATAAAIPGARLVTYPGMGHDLPMALWPQIAAEITKLTTEGA
ncbi:alpha/beta fold hydrolase [Nonomuraea jiangxiensis]|uniref:Pimeloyl-ACP methyl ester carboxylesterase n=1 Tax=Nonomuraea jiangxiensis TaxID=633440 RepID=A0A1G9A4U0_9ACTN|nr:alpha/beta hydrolase [Nonomuraea jiangxiensis]SDK22297.1 Pimeloyl-ACP methyl ester carboxylesterase [Nonomuraea jiangxiensis]